MSQSWIARRDRTGEKKDDVRGNILGVIFSIRENRERVKQR